MTSCIQSQSTENIMYLLLLQWPYYYLVIWTTGTYAALMPTVYFNKPQYIKYEWKYSILDGCDQ